MTGPRVAWTVWGATQAFAVAGLLLLAAGWDAPVPDSWGFRAFTSLFAFAFGTVGAVIVARRRNTVGWLLLALGLLSGVQAFGEEYAIYGHLANPVALPGASVMAWVGSWIWVPGVTLGVVFVPLLFPDGRLPSRRWRVVVVGTGLNALAMVVGLAFASGPLNNAPYLENPFAAFATVPAEIVAPLYPGLFLWSLLAAVSVVRRYRSAHGIEQQQIKWFGYGVGVLVAGLLASVLFQENEKWAQYALIGSMLALATSVGIAILRYRLYDIDILINRTLVYGVLSALVASTYIALVILLQALLRPLTGGSELAVAGSTLATLALIQPLRRRIQEAVDRRFYRSRYDAARILDSFASRLRDEVDLDAVKSDLLSATDETVRPRHAGVWLRAGRG